MPWRRCAVLLLGLAPWPSTAGAGVPAVPAGWVVAEQGHGTFRRSVPGPAFGPRPVPGPRLFGRPFRAGHRPFGSVQGGLETGIGFGYPALYPTGGGAPIRLPRLFHGR